jgi:hypothetical protein
MKKSGSWIAGLFLFSSAIAQPGLSVNAGISIPIMCYTSANTGNSNAGYARTGLTLDISYTHPFNATTGFKTLLYFTSNPSGNNTVLSNGPFRMAGLMAGPSLTSNNNRKWQCSFSPLAGFSRVWVPQLRLQGQPLLYAQSVNCFSWGADLSLRYRISENSFLRLGAGHLNMKPRLDARHTTSAKSEQHIVVVSTSAGIGWQW